MMPVFLCRWQNGDFSVVKAINKDQAIEFLDEVGNAEDCTITPLKDFMVHFKLADDAEFVLESYGEMTFEHILRLGYPQLDKALLDAPTDTTGMLTQEGRKVIRQAVYSERERLWVKESEHPKTEPQTLLGRRVQAGMDAPSKMIDRIMEKVTREKLSKFKGKGKTN
jgi:hypothetical protein